MQLFRFCTSAFLRSVCFDKITYKSENRHEIIVIEIFDEKECTILEIK